LTDATRSHSRAALDDLADLQVLQRNSPFKAEGEEGVHDRLAMSNFLNRMPSTGPAPRQLLIL
jgi:hypothetical protein